MQMEVRKWMAAAVAALMVARIFADDSPTVIPAPEVPSAAEMGFDVVELAELVVQS
tara:strand:+ start:271 stop:438 length:168 start_codon:yes stop_codon:yes gene_type:complete